MAAAAIDYAEQQPQEQAQVDSPTAVELRSMAGIGAILRPLYDAERTFAGLFTQQMATEVVAFRDAHWTPKSHDRVRIGGVDMTWNDFVEQFFGVARSWLNKLLRRHATPEIGSTAAEAEEAEVEEEDDNNEGEAGPPDSARDRIFELEAEVGQLTAELELAKEAAQQSSPCGADELDRVAKVIQRRAVGSVVAYARILERLIARAGYDDRIKVVVE